MHGTNRKYKRRVRFYEPEVNEKDYKAVLVYYSNARYSYWSGQYIGKYQQKLLVVTDCKVQIIGYGYVNLTGVDGNGDENKAPLKTESEHNLDYQEDQEEVHP